MIKVVEGIAQIESNQAKINERKELAIAKQIREQIATENPTGDYTGKYIRNTYQGDEWIKINHYKNGLIHYKYGLKNNNLGVNGVNGRLSIYEGSIKLDRDVDTAVSEIGQFHFTTMRFKEGLNKQGNKTIIVELFNQGEHLGTFIKTESKVQDLVKDD